MNAREYLVKKGLAKEGARGRFSRSALAALQEALDSGVKFDDYSATGRLKVEAPKKQVIEKTLITAPTIKQSAVVRSESVCYGVSKAENSAQKDIIVAFASCAECNTSVARCTHEAPILPAWFGGGVGMLTKPSV